MELTSYNFAAYWGNTWIRVKPELLDSELHSLVFERCEDRTQNIILAFCPFRMFLEGWVLTYLALYVALAERSHSFLGKPFGAMIEIPWLVENSERIDLESNV